MPSFRYLLLFVMSHCCLLNSLIVSSSNSLPSPLYSTRYTLRCICLLSVVSDSNIFSVAYRVFFSPLVIIALGKLHPSSLALLVPERCSWVHSFSLSCLLLFSSLSVSFSKFNPPWCPCILNYMRWIWALGPFCHTNHLRVAPDSILVFRLHCCLLSLR